MTYSSRLLLAAATSSANRAKEIARSLQGIAYTDERDDPSGLPFAGLATGVTDDLDALRAAADVGVYLVCERTVKPGSAAFYGLFPMLRHPQKTHLEADTHWRDEHGPLALEHHAYMSHYLQLSVLQSLAGPHFDGFALCGFETLADLKERFFTTSDSPKVIAEDVAKFADVASAPRRLIAQPEVFTSG